MVRTPQKAVVKVYGTQFNVEAYADDKTITATLVEGSIAMAYENKKSNWTEQEIQPGQEIVFTSSGFGRKSHSHKVKSGVKG